MEKSISRCGNGRTSALYSAMFAFAVLEGGGEGENGLYFVIHILVTSLQWYDPFVTLTSIEKFSPNAFSSGMESIKCHLYFSRAE